MTTPADMTGPELDAAVAREVMGWKQPHSWRIGDWSPPRYSTDIAAAFEVVGRMLASGWRTSISGGCTDTPWIVQFINDDTGECYYGIGPAYASLPRAICEAALAAVREGR